VRRIVGVALLAALCAAPVAAQEADTALAEAPVRMSNFPYLLATPNDGVFGAFRVIRYRQAPWDARVTNLREHSVDAGYSTRGAWFVRGDYKRLWLDEGWRVRGSITASREARVARSDSVEFALGVPPNFVERQRQMGWVDVTRRLQGRLQAAVRVSLDRQRLEGDPIELGSRFPNTPWDGPLVLCPDGATDCGLLWQSVTITQTDPQARLALVFDSRDNEYNPNRGVLAEAGAFVGGAGEGYTGAYGIVRGWISPRQGTRLTARYAARTVSETQAVGIQQGIPGWESPLTTIGGPNSHRALPVGALTGRTVQFASAEVRHELLNFGGLGAVALLGFVDAGRLTLEEEAPLTIACVACVAAGPAPEGGRWIVGAGAGVGIRVLRAAQLSITGAKANGETRWYVAMGWGW